MIHKQEFIGKKAEIKYSRSLFKGTIIGETKNLLYLKTQQKIVKVIKKNSIIKIGKHKINGKHITKRPEDRIKK